MVVKLPATIRRRRSIALLTAAVAGSAIAVAGCGGGSDSGSSAGRGGLVRALDQPALPRGDDGPRRDAVDPGRGAGQAVPGLPGAPAHARPGAEVRGRGLRHRDQAAPRRARGDRRAPAARHRRPAGRRSPRPTPATRPRRPTTSSSSRSSSSPTTSPSRSRTSWSRRASTSRGERAGAEYFAQGDEDGVVAITDDALVFTDTEAAAVHRARRPRGRGRPDAGRHRQVHRRAGEAAGRGLRPGLPRHRRLRARGRRGRRAAGRSSSAWTTTARPSWRRRSPPSPRARA